MLLVAELEAVLLVVEPIARLGDVDPRDTTLGGLRLRVRAAAGVGSATAAAAAAIATYPPDSCAFVSVLVTRRVDSNSDERALPQDSARMGWREKITCAVIKIATADLQIVRPASCSAIFAIFSIPTDVQHVDSRGLVRSVSPSTSPRSSPHTLVCFTTLVLPFHSFKIQILACKKLEINNLQNVLALEC